MAVQREQEYVTNSHSDQITKHLKLVLYLMSVLVNRMTISLHHFLCKDVGSTVLCLTRVNKADST